jgi:uncharacterized protein YxeA
MYRMKSTKILIAVIIVLFLIICAMAWYLVVTPSKASHLNTSNSTTTNNSSANTSSSTEPLSAHVTVSSPQRGASVERTFTVTGVAPGPWYFEAVFPIQIRDADDNLVATGQGHAQSDWMVEGPVPFTATITVPTSYSGPADLILLRDNPSMLPENSDEVTIPIIII